ncbi:alpha/beta fold hydrolase [Brachybacterium saurashtrense]|uniref:Alpha/beta hydrolase n=1 Tax=Brachybacterium saurashtrense TaxID=556288 RepID=A0A345YNY6_9MICO|nr:alpha/beta hydrolase [Brachybacterium saurashtrense]AXK45638.1 alpha/beta hydrolase [Brachybacterium saurashtrense]RRR24655.1 alpha/beta hydrolase [Brachybacterium saurashtrense]
MPVIPSPVDGVDLRYDVSGDGPPLVLLHGSVLSRAIWRGLGYLAPLAAEQTVLRLDLRGHGLSGTPHDPAAYTQEVFVEDLLAVLDAEGIGRAALLGYSLGARIALSTALAHPDRVSRLVSLGGSASAQRGAVDAVFFPGVIEAVRDGGMEAFCAGQGLSPGVDGRRARATRTAFLAADPLAIAALLAATDATDAVPDHALADCSVPALWMAGSEDHPRHEESRRAAALMPDAEFVSLPGRDHGGTLATADEVLAHVLPFLR